MTSIKNCIKPCYLSTYLNSSYGQIILDREKTLSAQPTVAMSRIRNIVIPLSSINFQEKIEQLIKLANELISNSNNFYLRAEQMLLEELGMTHFTPSAENITIKSLTNSFSTSGRLDAEYYQPKYDQIKHILNTSDTIKSVCKLYDKNFTPNIDKEYKYIELSNVGISGEIFDVDSIIGKELPTRARRLVKKGQVIVSSIEGSLQSCALITDEYNNSLCSTGFYVVDSNKINSETLLVLFKSNPIQELLKQSCSGTILTSVSKDDFLKVTLPLINDNVQIQIAEKIKECFKLRQQNKALLNHAKQAVEMAIEQGEEKAIEWLFEAVDSLSHLR